MFFAGSPDLGVCPSHGTGGHHNPLGGNFVLPHPISPSLRLVDSVTEVEVVGNRYTPDSHVSIDYGYKSPGDSSHSARGNLTVMTDSSGHFGNESFPVPSDAFEVGARGVDNITGTDAIADPIRLM
jgi:hypothetical protein